MKNQIFWKILMAGSVAGWLYLLGGIFFPLEHTALKIFWWFILLGWGILHPLELAMSLPIGREKGFTPEQIFIKTMAFGFTWWVPVKLGIFDE